MNVAGSCNIKALITCALEAACEHSVKSQNLRCQLRVSNQGNTYYTEAWHGARNGTLVTTSKYDSLPSALMPDCFWPTTGPLVTPLQGYLRIVLLRVVREEIMILHRRARTPAAFPAAAQLIVKDIKP